MEQKEILMEQKRGRRGMKLSLLALGFVGLVVGGCSAGSSPGSSSGSTSTIDQTAAATGTVSMTASGVMGAVDAAVAQAGGTTAALEMDIPDHPDAGDHPTASDHPDGNPPSSSDGQGDQGDDSDAFANCTVTDNGDGTMTRTCDCTANNVTQGTVTQVFSHDVSHGTCTNDAGMSMPTLSVHGMISTTFDNCIVDKCGQVVTLNSNGTGSLDGTMDHEVDTCQHTESSTVTFSTPGLCDGDRIAVTLEDGSTVMIGIQATVTRGGGKPTVSGNVCVDDGSGNPVTTPFDSLESLRMALDPNGTCEDSGDSEDSGDTEDSSGDSES
jgi:hypothetical protein